MSPSHNSEPVDLALAHIRAWSEHDYETARNGLADDVKVTAVTTLQGAPRADLIGAEAYMRGLRAFADPIVPGSLRIESSLGAGRNALVVNTVDIDGPPFGPSSLTNARLYLFGEDDKIQSEHVVFYLLPR
jgi:hypothetical protein